MRSLFTAVCLVMVAACGGREAVAPSAVTAPVVASGDGSGRLTPATDRKTYLSVFIQIDTDADGVLSVGDTLGVNWGIAPSVHDDVNLWVRCTQNGTQVYADSINRYDTTPHPFILGPTATWPSGGADCRATLETVARQSKTIAATSFTVDP